MKTSALIQKYRKVFWGGAALALLGLGAWSLRWWEGPEVPIERVVERDFVQLVVASGHVETPHRVAVGSQITGTMLRVPGAGGRGAAGERGRPAGGA